MSLLQDRMEDRRAERKSFSFFRLLKYLFFLALVLSVIILLNRFVGVIG